jgi:glucose dehydrogenase
MLDISFTVETGMAWMMYELGFDFWQNEIVLMIKASI